MIRRQDTVTFGLSGLSRILANAAQTNFSRTESAFMEASASPVHMDLQRAMKYSGGPFLTALCRAVTFHTSKFRARAETALFLSPFTLPSSAITVIRLQLSDFDSARTRPV